MLAIGYPLAGKAWDGINWDAMRPSSSGGVVLVGGSVVVAQSATYPDGASMGGAVTFLSHGGVLSGDITGKQGAGRGGAGAIKRARACGVGQDRDAADVARLAAWVQAAEVEAVNSEQAQCLRASRRAIVGQLLGAEVFGRWVLSLCGGPDWSDGGAIHLRGAGMAARAARYIEGMRGREASATSLSEAAADAVSVVWREWCNWSALLGGVVDSHARRYLAGVAWRAAHASLTRGAGQGGKGRGAGKSIVLLSIDQASEADLIWQGSPDVASESAGARARVVRWLVDVLGVRRGGGVGGAANRRRLRVLVRLLHGATWPEAAMGAGFASVGAAVESFRSGKVWSILESDCARGAMQSERARSLRVIRRGAGLAARLAIKSMRRLRLTRPVASPSKATEARARAEQSAQAHESTGARLDRIRVRARDVRPKIDTQRARGVLAQWSKGTADHIESGWRAGQSEAAYRRALAADKFAIHRAANDVATSGGVAWSRWAVRRAAAIERAKRAAAGIEQLRADWVASFRSASKGLRAGALR